MKKTVWIAVAFVAAVVAYVVFSSLTPQRFRYRVCMSFEGARDCRTASASTEELAIRTAITNACAQISSGVVKSSQCENTPPESVEWLH